MIYGRSFYQINISADTIKALKEFYNPDGNENDIITEAFISKSNSIKLKNQNDIDAKVMSVSKDITETIRDKGINKSVIEKIQDKLVETYTSIAELLTDSDLDEFRSTEYDANKLKNALILVILAGAINSIVNVIFMTIFGPQIGSTATSVICAPLVEETCKQVSIKGGFIKEFAVIFNAYEFTQYAIINSSLGIKFINVLVARGAVVLMHLTTTIIQYITSNTKILDKLGFTKEKNKKEIGFIGNVLGICIHSLWNAFATGGKLNFLFTLFK